VTVVNKNYLYLPDSASGVHVISIADPAYPIEVGFLNTPTGVGRIVVAGRYAYMTDGGELLVVSVADPANPAIVATFDPSDTMMSSVAVSGDYAYVLDYDHGLIVVSVADPLHPVEVGRCDLAYTYVVAVSGSYVWAGGLDGSSVISVADPAHPVKVGSFGVAQVTDVAMDGDIAYEAASGWLFAVSIADPANPLEIGHYKAAFTAFGVALSHGYVYSAGASGLLVVQYYGSGVEENPKPNTTSHRLAATVIRNLPAGAALFDAMGRKVTGPRAGVYFLQGEGETRKVVVQR
jgi:hypothetical protein